MGRGRLTKDQLLVFTSPMLELFQEKGKADIGNLIALYVFYLYTAKWQRTNCIKCTTSYAAKGLGWTASRIRKTKMGLKELELIEDVMKKKTSGRGKEKFIGGWYIQLKYLLKEETLMEILSTHPMEFPDSGISQTVGDQEGNALNTLIINALNTPIKNTTNVVYGKASLSQETPVKSNPSISQEELFPHIRLLLQRLLDTGLFTQKMRDPGERGYKTLLNCQRFLLTLGTPEFMKLYRFDPGWMKRDNIDPEILRRMNDKGTLFEDLGFDLKSLVELAIERYTFMFDPLYHPPSKGFLTDKLDKFLYNYGAKSSYFLCCIFNPPKMLKKAKKMIEEARLDNLGLSSRDRSFLEDWGKGWDPVGFKARVKELKDWWDNNRWDLDVFHQMGGNHGSWRSYFYGFHKLLMRLKEYQEYWGVEWKLGNFGMGNKTWDNFLSWIKERYPGIDLAPSKKKIQAAVKYRELEEETGPKIDYKKDKSEQDKIDSEFAEKILGRGVI